MEYTCAGGEGHHQLMELLDCIISIYQKLLSPHLVLTVSLTL